jgi:hypothetical protein
VEKMARNQRLYLLDGPAPKGKVKKHLYMLLKNGSEPNVNPDPSFPTDASLPWPYTGGTGVAAEVNRLLGSPEQSREELLARLNAFDYPYPGPNKKHKTFYDHLKTQGMLQVVIQPPFLWKVRMVWWWRIAFETELELKKSALSKCRMRLRFHKQMMNLISEHHSRVSALGKTHGIVGQPWIVEYLAALDRQFLKEAENVYPDANRRLVPASQLSIYPFGSAPQVEIYRAILDGQKRCEKKRNKKFACQLTALICSSADSIREKKLEPNPAAVRQNILQLAKHRKNRV